MRRILATAVVLALAILSRGPSACYGGNITYNIVNDLPDQNGYSLTGTITTDGTIGSLGDNDIVSWQFTITCPGGPYVNSSAQGGIIALVGPVAATPNAINVPSHAQLVLGEAPLTQPGTYVFWENAPPSASDYAAYDRSESKLIWGALPPVGYGTGTWTIATASVPEPSTVVLAGTAGVCGLAIRLVRKRRAHRAESSNE